MAGVSLNSADGFAFFVNQPLTISDREKLQSMAAPTTTEIYSLERMRAILDSPKGCGARLEYLRIPMNEAEQWAFWSAMNYDVVRRLSDNEKRRDAQMSQLQAGIDQLLLRTSAIEYDLRKQASSPGKAALPITGFEMPTASFTSATLCWLHRVLTEDMELPESSRGRFRSVQVWVGVSGSTIETAQHIPPAPSSLPALVDDWLDWWHTTHKQLLRKPKADVAAGLAALHHHFLVIHSFFDANGRIARSITDQAARELLNEGRGMEFVDRTSDYYNALQAADRGDIGPLTMRVIAALQ